MNFLLRKLSYITKRVINYDYIYSILGGAGNFVNLFIKKPMRF